MWWLALAVAHAECGMPWPVWSVGDGAVPDDPTVLLFWAGMDFGPTEVHAVDEAGVRREVTVTALPSGPNVAAWSVHVDTDGPGRVSLEARWPEGTGVAPVTAELRVRAGAVEVPPVQITAEGATAESWTCSHQATRDLSLRAPGALGFVVRAAADGVPLDGPEVQEVVLPPHPDLLWGSRDGRGQRLELGHADCLGDTLVFAGSLTVQIAAIGAGGQRGPWTAPRVLEVPVEADGMEIDIDLGPLSPDLSPPRRGLFRRLRAGSGR